MRVQASDVCSSTHADSSQLKTDKLMVEATLQVIAACSTESAKDRRIQYQCETKRPLPTTQAVDRIGRQVYFRAHNCISRMMFRLTSCPSSRIPKQQCTLYRCNHLLAIANSAPNTVRNRSTPTYIRGVDSSASRS